MTMAIPRPEYPRPQFVRVDIKFLAPARMGDELELRLTTLNMGRVKMKLPREIFNITAKNKSASAIVHGAMLDTEGKPVQFPDEFKKAFLAHPT